MKVATDHDSRYSFFFLLSSFFFALSCHHFTHSELFPKMQTLSFPLFTHSLSSLINPLSPFPSLSHFSSLSVSHVTARRSIPLQASTRDSAFSSSPVAVDNSDAGDSTAFVIRARNRIGLLQVITRVFKVLGLTVDRATVEFEGDFFVKKFFVTDSHGNKIEDSDSLERIKRALAEAVGGDGDGTVLVARPAAGNPGVVVRRPGLVEGDGERRAKAERMFSLMDGFLKNDPFSLQKDILNHVEYTVARSRFNFDDFEAYQVLPFNYIAFDLCMSFSMICKREKVNCICAIYLKEYEIKKDFWYQAHSTPSNS